jgi:ribosomal protein S8
MTLKDRILEHLKTKGEISSKEAIDAYGVTRLAAVVFELKCNGHNIMSEIRTVTNRYGDDCRVSFYKLIGD